MIQTPEATSFASVKKFFSASSNASPALPFSYVDAAHTRVAPPPKSGWFSSWASNFSQSESWFETLGLSRIQRYIAFGITIFFSLILFLVAFIRFPFVILSPRKFVVPYCFASLLVVVSFGFIHGFVSYSKHLFSADRRLVSALFLGTTLTTLYVAVSLHSYILTAVFSVIQFLSLISYVISYLPGGKSGLGMMASMAVGSFSSNV